MIVLDTHALLWWQARARRLTRAATRAIDRADAIGVSAISFWEVARLIGEGRISLDRSLGRWVEDLTGAARIRLLPLDARIAAAAGALPGEGFHGDPADAIIYATSRDEAVPLVTKDRRMIDFASARGDLTTIW